MKGDTFAREDIPIHANISERKNGFKMRRGQIILTAEDGSEESFFVLEETKMAGETYLLVAEEEAGEEAEESNALILKQVVDNEIMEYKVLEDENELRIISKYFEELLEDINFELE